MKIVLFRDTKKAWRVRLVFSNGRIFATTEAYTSHAKALKSAKRFYADHVVHEPQIEEKG